MQIKGFRDTINWYNQNAQVYSKSILNYSSPEQIDEFVKLVPKSTKVLDAGCASGRDSKLLLDKEISVIGIDLSSELIKIAKKNYPDIKFVEGNFLNLPFIDKMFGGIWAHASLLHFENTEDVFKALSEFYRVLMKNGIIHVLVKAQTTINKYNIVIDKLSKHNRFFQFFTKEEIKDLLQRSSFKIIKLEHYREIDKNPNGRPEVEWIVCLGKK